ncbi:hypothetical protein BT69DRAFT_1281004 [Atractiella rhizophila]|nr:hypothetical protein BT69DRAFT_1281004 [Atractiella rhizophila]
MQSKKRARAIADLPTDPLRANISQDEVVKKTYPPSIIKAAITMVIDDRCLTNLNVLGTFVIDGVLPLFHADSHTNDSDTLAQTTTKRLLAAITCAECDVKLPITTDDEEYTSEGLQNNARGDTLGHNSLGEETLFGLRRWENVGSQEAIGELLQALHWEIGGEYGRSLAGWRWEQCCDREVFSYSCKMLFKLIQYKDAQSAKELKGTMVPAEYSKALQDKMQLQDRLADSIEIAKEKASEVEQYQTYHPPPHHTGCGLPSPPPYNYGSAPPICASHGSPPAEHGLSPTPPPHCDDDAPAPVGGTNPISSRSGEAGSATNPSLPHPDSGGLFPFHIRPALPRIPVGHLRMKL